jgi:AcrR family transcriptional regulator
MIKKEQDNYHHGNLKEVLLKVAISLLIEYGPGELSLRKVAKKAGVSHAAPYRHFNSKNALLAAIAQQGFIALEAQISLIAQKFYDHPQKQLIETCVVYVEFVMQSPEIAQLMFGGYIDITSDKALLEASDNTLASLIGVMQKGSQYGLYIKHDHQALTLVVRSLVHGFAMLIIGKQLSSTIDSKQQVRILTRMLCEMLLRGIGTNEILIE